MTTLHSTVHHPSFIEIMNAPARDRAEIAVDQLVKNLRKQGIRDDIIADALFMFVPSTSHGFEELEGQAGRIQLIKLLEMLKRYRATLNEAIEPLEKMFPPQKPG